MQFTSWLICSRFRWSHHIWSRRRRYGGGSTRTHLSVWSFNGGGRSADPDLFVYCPLIFLLWPHYLFFRFLFHLLADFRAVDESLKRTFQVRTCSFSCVFEYNGKSPFFLICLSIVVIKCKNLFFVIVNCKNMHTCNLLLMPLVLLITFSLML